MVLTTLLLGIFSAMSVSTNLSPQQVVKALEVLSNDETTELVFHLGVHANVLKDIEKGRTLKIYAIQAWLDKDTGASWEKITSALKAIGKDVLAKEVAKQHCPQSSYVATPSFNPSQPASVLTTQPVTTPAPVTPAIPSSVATTSADDSEQSPNTATSDRAQSLAVDMRSVANVKTTILRLEETFSDLISDTRSVLCERESLDKKFLDRFRDRLLILPVAKKAAHVRFFRESEDDIIAAKSIRKLFAILSRYWSYRNYEILSEIVHSFCDNLKGSMQQYCQSLEEFERATAVDVYTKAISAGKKLEMALSEMVLRIKKSESNCSLYEIRKLKEEIAEEASLHSHSVYIVNESVQCVEVVVAFPSSAVGWVLSAMTPAFMHTHLLSEVAVDGRQLTIIEADSDESVSVYCIHWPMMMSSVCDHVRENQPYVGCFGVFQQISQKYCLMDVRCIFGQLLVACPRCSYFICAILKTNIAFLVGIKCFRICGPLHVRVFQCHV